MGLVGDGVLGVWHGIAPGMERVLDDWYNDEHNEERVAIDGFLRALGVQATEEQTLPSLGEGQALGTFAIEPATDFNLPQKPLLSRWAARSRSCASSILFISALLASRFVST